MQHILLTGATGFLGSHLLDALLAQGYEVTILKRSTSDTWRIEQLIEKIRVFDIDKLSIKEVFKSKQIDVVIHLATCYKKYEETTDISEMSAVNIGLPSEILIEGLKCGIKGFINTGTYFEYDCSMQPVDEQADVKAFNYYAATKIAFENILKCYSENIAITTFKVFSPYGEKDNDKLIPLLIKNSLGGKKITLSEGFQKIDLIYIQDIVSAYMQLLDFMKNKSYKPGYEVYNLGSGFAYSMRDLVSIIEQLQGRKMDIAWGEADLRSYNIVYADVSKAFNVFGWKPIHTLKHGLSKCIDYYESVRYQ